MTRNIKLVVAYDGTDFHGWQTQPGLRTVQEELEQVLQRVVRHPVAVTASGRTDASRPPPSIERTSVVISTSSSGGSTTRSKRRIAMAATWMRKSRAPPSIDTDGSAGPTRRPGA